VTAQFTGERRGDIRKNLSGFGKNPGGDRTGGGGEVGDLRNDVSGEG
jgi:hypothetical protein